MHLQTIKWLIWLKTILFHSKNHISYKVMNPTPHRSLRHPYHEIYY